MSRRPIVPFAPLPLLSLLLAVAPPGEARAQDPADPPDETSVDEMAIAWVGLLQREQFDSAAAEVAPAVASQLDAAALTGAWGQITGQFGALESLEPGTRAEQAGYRIVNLAGSFEGGPYTVRVVYDGEDRVAGFFVLPPGGGAAGG